MPASPVAQDCHVRLCDLSQEFVLIDTAKVVNGYLLFLARKSLGQATDMLRLVPSPFFQTCRNVSTRNPPLPHAGSMIRSSGSGVNHVHHHLHDIARRKELPLRPFERGANEDFKCLAYSIAVTLYQADVLQFADNVA